MNNRFVGFKWQFIWLPLLIGLTTSSSWAAKSRHPVQNSIVKISATHNHPDYRSPWQRQGIHAVTGSGVIISGNRILTNAHVVADQTLLEVQREGSGNSYLADVQFVCHSCDLALLTVEDSNFFNDTHALEIDGLPRLQSRVHVYGFPTGGETISITEGIVSRIELDYYVHSSDRFLLVQVDAAINPGNSGGPVISNGKIVGIAMQALEQAENIGYIVPSPIIEHFLKDVEDGRYDGFPELDIYIQLLENKALRQTLNVPDKYGGLLVTGVSERNIKSGVIKPGDLLLEIDGHAIGRDGKIDWENGLRIESSHLEYLKQVGESLDILLYRNGSKIKKKILLTVKKPRVNQRLYDKAPTYFVFAGLVFQPLNSGYLKAAHGAQYSLISYVPLYTLEGYKKMIPDRIKSDRDEVVILSRILPDSVNHGYKDMETSVIYSVNGKPVKDIKHLIKLVENTQGPFLKIITDYGNLIAIDVKKAKNRKNKILQNYQVHVDRSPDLQ